MNTKIDIGRVVSNVFEIYRDQAGVLLPVALVIFVGEGILSGLLVSITPFLIVVAVVIQVIATWLYQGMVVQLVADVQDGRRDSSVGDLLRSVTPVLGALILAGILAGLGIAVGFILLIVPGLFLITIWSLVAPVVVLERPGVGAAFGRSRELVRGNGWQVFGVIVVFFAILVVVSLILSGIGNAIGPAGSVVGDILASVLAAPLVALAGTVLYFTLVGTRGAQSGSSGAGAQASGQAGAVGSGSPPAGGPASGQTQTAPGQPSQGQGQPARREPGQPRGDEPSSGQTP